MRLAVGEGELHLVAGIPVSLNKSLIGFLLLAKISRNVYNKNKS